MFPSSKKCGYFTFVIYLLNIVSEIPTRSVGIEYADCVSTER